MHYIEADTFFTNHLKKMNMKIIKQYKCGGRLYHTPMIEVIKIDIEQNILESASGAGYTTPLGDIPGEYW